MSANDLRQILRCERGPEGLPPRMSVVMAANGAIADAERTSPPRRA